MSILLLGFVLLLYGFLCAYIGIKGWYTLFRSVPFINKVIYGTLYFVIAFSYFIVRILDHYLPDSLKYFLTLTGSYWMAIVYYLTLIIIVLSLIKLMAKITGVFPAWLKRDYPGPHPVALGVMAILIVLLIYGRWNAANPQVAHYDLTIPKQAGSLNSLHLVMVSDIHLDRINDRNKLIKMVDQINALNPDLVLLAGDIYDDQDVKVFDQQKMAALLQKLHPKYGVYGIVGNHEYISGPVDAIISRLEEGNVKMLRDDVVKVADSFYIMGRDDLSGNRFQYKRQDLKALMQQVKQKYPIILLDHQPSHLEEADSLGVDLQLSGHTHAGQLYPNRLITKKMYEKDWGYLAKKHLQVIVSCGYGTWGPPIRIGSRSEIVDIKVQFQAK